MSSETLTVYRICIEEKTDCGIFWSGRDLYDKAQRISDYHSMGEHPGPYCLQENGTELHDLFRGSDRSKINKYFFGGTSLAQLKRCFPSYAGRKAIAVEGYAVHVFEVARKYVAKGNWQCAFRLDKATLVDVIPMEDFR